LSNRNSLQNRELAEARGLSRKLILVERQVLQSCELAEVRWKSGSRCRAVIAYALGLSRQLVLVAPQVLQSGELAEALGLSRQLITCADGFITFGSSASANLRQEAQRRLHLTAFSQMRSWPRRS
jgi:pyrroloquinoline quinone (PQQ) biosynthesis protein C